jgi:predicted ribosome quality control (RQC) complex YloA/Tae2 family protein
LNPFPTVSPPSSNLTIDKLNEASIREWFDQFGPLKEIIFDPSRHQGAILVYADWESASKAWNDPRPVFSNRFVKIFWKRSETEKDGNELETAREAAVKAQKEHEEKQKRKLELEKKKEELEKQRLELVERQRLERERLMERIKNAQEKAKDKVRGVVHSASKSVETGLESQVNGGQANGDKRDDESSRKEKLQSLLTDLKNQVYTREIN